MRIRIFCILLALSATAATSWGDSGAGGQTDLLKQLENRASEAKSGKAAEYAPEALKEALVSVSAAQAAAAGSNQKLARQKIERSGLLLSVAEAKAAERESLELVAVQRRDLKNLEARLERNLQGEEKP